MSNAVLRLIDSGRGLVDPDAEFWDARADLALIRGWARARMVSPWALFGCVLARAVTAAPPGLVLPPLIGTPASLNMFVALVGPSGSGKSEAARLATHVAPWPGNALTGVHAPVEIPAGSGEGLVSAFGSMTPDKESGAWELRIEHDRVLCRVDEIDALAAQSSRTGSTVMALLRTGWSGGVLGFQYRAKEKNTQIPAESYRLAIVAGVQPARAGFLLGDSDGGTPQRFLWMPTRDPHATTDAPEPDRRMQLQAPEPGTITVPDAVRAEVRAARKDATTGDRDPLDGHRLLVREKIAAGLAILAGHPWEVTPEDWELSAHVLAVSDRTRGECVTAVAAIDRDRAEKAGRDAEARSEAQRGARLDRIRTRALTKLEDGPTTEVHVRRTITERDRPHLDEVLGALADEGKIRRYTDGATGAKRIELTGD